MVDGLLVSPDDRDLVDQYPYSVSSFGYVIVSMGSRDRQYALHRVVAERMYGPCPDGMVVDHVNRNRLDNRRENLRYVDRVLHSHNRTTRSKNGYRGVEKNTTGGGYRGSIKKNGVRYRSSTYRTSEEAARWYDRKARELYGDDAVTNKESGWLTSD